MKKLIMFASLVCALVAMSCSDKNHDNAQVHGIKIESTLTMLVGETKTLEVQVLPENTTEKGVFVWSSSDETILRIEENGAFTALKSGQASVTVELDRDKKIKAECLVTISNEEGELDPNAVVVFEDIQLSAIMLQYDTNHDGRLQVSELLVITTLVISDNNIESLKGLENLRNLEILDASRNSISEFDFSKNIKLKELYIKNNKLKNLDLNALPQLEVLDCSANRLSKIDVTNNLELKNLRIALNHEGRGDNGLGITELDVTKNAKLEVLDLNYTNVSKLDLSQNPKLKWIDFGLTGYTSPESSPITVIDFSNNKELEHISCNAMVRTYNMDGELIKDKKGLNILDVTMLPKLKHLNFEGNSIASIDLSKNGELSHLNIAKNYIENLDVTNNSKLEYLNCEWSKLSALDLSKNVALTELNCANNKIKSLDISNTAMSYLLANDNEIATLGLGDKVFDTLKDGKPYLYLKLNNNKIKTIDLSKQKNLAWVEINDNELTKLDISNCTNLGGALFNNNMITTLNLSKIDRIWEVQGVNNQLSGNLDVSHLKLSRMYLEGNPNLRNISVWSGFDEGCTSLIADHTTGKTESRKCYSKDATASWIR